MEGGAVYLNVDQFAEIAGVSVKTVWRWIAADRLKYVQPGGKRTRVLIHRNALEIMSKAVESHPSSGVNNETIQPIERLAGRPPQWTQNQ
jgi:excisionase family DNA binding protein